MWGFGNKNAAMVRAHAAAAAHPPAPPSRSAPVQEKELFNMKFASKQLTRMQKKCEKQENDEVSPLPSLAPRRLRRAGKCVTPPSPVPIPCRNQEGAIKKDRDGIGMGWGWDRYGIGVG